MRTWLEHRFNDENKPEGLHLTVEHLPYFGTVDGKPSYGLTAAQKWRAYCITTWVGIALFAAFKLTGHF